MSGDLTYDPLDEIEDEKLDAAREAAWRKKQREAEKPGESFFDRNQIIWKK